MHLAVDRGLDPSRGHSSQRLRRDGSVQHQSGQPPAAVVSGLGTHADGAEMSRLTVPAKPAVFLRDQTCGHIGDLNSPSNYLRGFRRLDTLIRSDDSPETPGVKGMRNMTPQVIGLAAAGALLIGVT